MGRRRPVRFCPGRFGSSRFGSRRMRLRRLTVLGCPPLITVFPRRVERSDVRVSIRAWRRRGRNDCGRPGRVGIDGTGLTNGVRPHLQPARIGPQMASAAIRFMARPPIAVIGQPPVAAPPRMPDLHPDSTVPPIAGIGEPGPDGPTDTELNQWVGVVRSHGVDRVPIVGRYIDQGRLSRLDADAPPRACSRRRPIWVQSTSSAPGAQQDWGQRAKSHRSVRTTARLRRASHTSGGQAGGDTSALLSRRFDLGPWPLSFPVVYGISISSSSRRLPGRGPPVSWRTSAGQVV